MQLERKTVHISDDTGRIAMYEYRTQGWDNSPQDLIRYIYSNNLSSSMLELDDNGQIISYEEYHPFGTTAYQATNASINAVAKRYRYTGKERDEESGLYYHGARYYIPWLCRWTQCDPIGIKDGLNVYAYCSNNPVMLNDPSGTSGGSSEERPKDDCATKTIIDPTGKEGVAANSVNQSEDKKHLTNSAANGNWDYADWQDVGEGKGYYKVHYKSAGQQFSDGFLDGVNENLNTLIDAVTSKEGLAFLAAGAAIIYFVPGAGQVALALTIGYMAYKSLDVAAKASEGNYYEAGKGTGELTVDVGVIVATEGTATALKNVKDVLKTSKTTTAVTRSLSQGSETLDDMARMSEQELTETTVLEGASEYIGVDLEDFLATKLPKSGKGFSEGGRDFDGSYMDDTIWFEAKSGNYWANQVSTEQGFAKFRSDMGHRLKIALENNKQYELFSNSIIPDNVKSWLTSKGIKFHEILH